jgi:hydroxymethylpyrimidine pyrophosphatase-like HAD family hydrolase
MMLCGTVERMRRAETRLLEHEWVAAVGETRALAKISLNRTAYPERDLSILDILPAGCSKGAALQRLATARGIPLSEMMAIGDNYNDLSMLEIAGFPVLMGNAPAEMKAFATDHGWEIAAHHGEDGVADAIERHLHLSRDPDLVLIEAGSHRVS